MNKVLTVCAILMALSFELFAQQTKKFTIADTVIFKSFDDEAEFRLENSTKGRQWAPLTNVDGKGNTQFIPIYSDGCAKVALPGECANYSGKTVFSTSFFRDPCISANIYYLDWPDENRLTSSRYPVTWKCIYQGPSEPCHICGEDNTVESIARQGCSGSTCTNPTSCCTLSLLSAGPLFNTGQADELDPFDYCVNGSYCSDGLINAFANGYGCYATKSADVNLGSDWRVAQGETHNIRNTCSGNSGVISYAGIFGKSAVLLNQIANTANAYENLYDFGSPSYWAGPVTVPRLGSENINKIVKTVNVQPNRTYEIHFSHRYSRGYNSRTNTLVSIQSEQTAYWELQDFTVTSSQGWKDEVYEFTTDAVTTSINILFSNSGRTDNIRRGEVYLADIDLLEGCQVYNDRPDEILIYSVCDSFYNEYTGEWLVVGDTIKHPDVPEPDSIEAIWQYTYFPSKREIEIIVFEDTSVQIDNNKLYLNETRIQGNTVGHPTYIAPKNITVNTPVGLEFGMMMTVRERYDEEGEWASFPGFPIPSVVETPVTENDSVRDVWAETNPNERVLNWWDNYFVDTSGGNRVHEDIDIFDPAGALGAADDALSTSSYLGADGFIWKSGSAGSFKINPTTNKVIYTGELYGASIAYPTVGPDGLVYLQSNFPNHVVINNPVARTLGLIDGSNDLSVGFTESNSWKASAISSLNGHHYAAPYLSDGPGAQGELRVKKTDLTTMTTSFIPNAISGGFNINPAPQNYTPGDGSLTAYTEYTSCVEAVNGKIICSPFTCDYILEIDPLTDTWIQWAEPVTGAPGQRLGVIASEGLTSSGGSGLGRGTWNFINHPNGKIYSIPWEGTQVAEIDPIARTITNVGSVYPQADVNDKKWGSAVLHTNGKIYAFPFDGGEAQNLQFVMSDSRGAAILEIDPVTVPGSVTTALWYFQSDKPVGSRIGYFTSKTALNGSIISFPQEIFGPGISSSNPISKWTPPFVTTNAGKDNFVFPIKLVTSPQFQSR